MLCGLLILLSGWAAGQTVINTEELRLQTSPEKVVGLLDLNFGLTRNKAGLSIKPRADLRLEWRGDRQKLILLGGYQLVRFTNLGTPGALPSNFTNRGFGHLRFNRSLSDKVTWESFAQWQFDEIQEIDDRVLLGAGPRLQLAQADSLFAFLGVLYMYEYEKTSADPALAVREWNHRLSAYLSLGVNFNAYVGLNNTTYLQPNLQGGGDFRISSISRLTTALTQAVSFLVAFELVYDSRPPETVPNEMYDLRAGIAINL